MVHQWQASGPPVRPQPRHDGSFGSPPSRRCRRGRCLMRDCVREPSSTEIAPRSRNESHRSDALRAVPGRVPRQTNIGSRSVMRDSSPAGYCEIWFRRRSRAETAGLGGSACHAKPACVEARWSAPIRTPAMKPRRRRAHRHQQRAWGRRRTKHMPVCRTRRRAVRLHPVTRIRNSFGHRPRRLLNRLSGIWHSTAVSRSRSTCPVR